MPNIMVGAAVGAPAGPIAFAADEHDFIEMRFAAGFGKPVTAGISDRYESGLAAPEPAMPTPALSDNAASATGLSGDVSYADPGNADFFSAEAAPFAGLAGSPAELAALAATSAIGANGATAAQLRQAFGATGLGLTGAGIKVGVLSDSFNALGGAAADEANGALPSTVQVLEDYTGSGASDEGRAMLQVVHDLASGASLAFYSAFYSEQDFADGILALANSGCKVICDDVGYFDEPFFQNGVIAQAIETVEAEGVVYVTAAGNDGNQAYQAAWTPISGSFDRQTLTDAESFGGSLTQTITVTASSRSPASLLLEWNQAYGAATSNLEMLIFKSGRLVGTATNVSSGEPGNPFAEWDFTSSGTFQVAIENLSGPNPGLIKEIAAGDGQTFTIGGANTGTVFGHAQTPGAITAGAVDAADTPAFGVSPAQSESFSSSGAGSQLLFADDGTPLSSPEALSPVVVSGIDDISTTVPGELSDFYGTSAASASIAGVVALILQANPALTPAQVEQVLEATASPMSSSAVSGAGLANAAGAVALARSMVSSAPAAANVPGDFNGDGISDVLWRNNTGGDTGYWLTNNGTVTGFHDFGGSDLHYAIAGVADFDAGTTPDILWSDSATGDTGYWLTNNGAVTGFHDFGAANTAYSIVGVGDFDSTGQAEVMFENKATGDTGYWTTDASGVVTGFHDLGQGNTAYSVVGTGDFDGGGQDEILWQNKSSGDTGYWTTNASGNITGFHDLGTESTAYSVAGVGDFDGSGHDEVLWENKTTGDTGYWATNSSGTVTGFHDLATAPAGYGIVGVGEFSGTGVSNVLLRNNGTGDIGYWNISGGNYTGFHDYGPSNLGYTVMPI